MEFLNSISGTFLVANTGYYVGGTIILALALGYTGAPFILWTLLGLAACVGFAAPQWALITVAVIGVIFNIKPLRQALISSGLMKVMKGFMPKISDTEKTALEAGVVWVEKDLFSGKPNFKNILNEPYPGLTKEEQDFMNGPVERLCAALDDYKIWQDRDIPADAWNIIKKEKFLGMIIPKEYGGLGFSALLHSEVIQKLAARSTPACVTVMVPNSLGPAELLIHYGTDEQKKRLLPRLAAGEELPCFALTEPTAGSDAGAMKAEGSLFKGDDGKLYIKLNWNKRYITLAAISTILGLAFKLKDPQNILGKGTDLGITCALIPSNTAGVVIGRRHDPMGVPFYNCPTQGNDVVVSVDCIVGGIDGAGRGWKMLMECLAAGRGISLPAQSVGGAKLITRATSAYATIRQQFNVEIGKFEAIEEHLGNIGGMTYLMEAARKYICGALDQGIKPPVVTAIAKYNQTELFRKLITEGMDILGGAAISRGPRNLLAHAWIGTPIGITVEGANIMTRALIIFGQGALRAHPYAFKEVDAIEKNDAGAFDKAFWGHVGHVVRNLFRSIILSLTRGKIASSPVGGPVAKHFKKLAWASASFAIMADIAMGSLGGTLKFREKITGRFADILSWMFLATATLRRYVAEGERKEDLPFVEYACTHAFNQIQEGFDLIFKNIGVPGMGWLFAGPIRWWSRLNNIGAPISDKNTHTIANALQSDFNLRERLTEGLFISKDPADALTKYENAFKTVKAAESIIAKIRKAVKEGKLQKARMPQLVEQALKANVISQDDVGLLKKSEELRLDAIQVDDYSPEEYFGKAAASASSLKTA